MLSLRGTEALSSPYEFELELVCDDPTVEPDIMLGADVELLFDRNGLTREFYGVVIEVEAEVGVPSLPGHEGIGARIRLAPALRLLEQEIDTCFFTGQTVVEILEQRLGAALGRYGRELDVASRLRERYDTRDYCVQFRESTFDFCSRIMEEEGISYVFVPDRDKHCERMVLVDNNDAAAAVESLIPEAIPIVAHQPEELDHESIQRFHWRNRQTPNRVVTRGYNYKDPTRHDEGEAEQIDRHQPRERALHLEGERRQIIDDPVGDPQATSFTGAGLTQRGTQAALLLQRCQSEAASGRGSSNATGFAAGAVFDLGEVIAATAGEHEFLLVRVTHHAKLDGTPGAVDHVYTNHFECIPRSRPFRPARHTPQPRVYGVQTGVVSGPTADEIHTDTLGRVKVKFHADRHGAADEHASCWIRVAQIWAGSGYGAMVIPRVGMEVVVSFVDGNPDCPLVTGCVYDGVNPPPQALPAEQSRTTFKTSSTPGGERAHELRFEDAEGREQIFVHAQRRMDLRVQGTMFQTCTGSLEQVIGHGPIGGGTGDRNSLVNGEVNEHLRKSRFTSMVFCDYRRAGESIDLVDRYTAHASERLQLSTKNLVIEASEVASYKSDKIMLAGSSDVTVKGGAKIVLESNRRIELKVGESFISIAPEGIDIQAPKLRLNSGGQVGEASDGLSAELFHIGYPIKAHAADTGREGTGGGGGRGGGGGGGRTNIFDTVTPPHAPPMTPPPPIPDKVSAKAGQGPREIISLAWAEQETWCSEPTTLHAKLDKDGAKQVELLRIKTAGDGSEVSMDAVEVGPGLSLAHTIKFENVLPREDSGNVYESHRTFVAKLRDAQTVDAIRLRFLSNLPSIHYRKNWTRFHIRIDNRAVIVGGTIEYTRGWLHYYIDLGDTVPSDTGGRIGVTSHGHERWHYCKTCNTKTSASGLVYWNGASWIPVPQTWSDDLGTKLFGLGVWREGDVTKTQMGTLAWPDAVPDWSKHALQHKDAELERAVDDIDMYWTDIFALKRVGCLSEDPSCCRLRVVANVNFAESSVRRTGGIILTENDTRANAGAWPYDVDAHTVAHEFGHHLGNPDEYPGAQTVDPSVNTDGATAGIDPDSLMGSGYDLRRRHFNTVCKALTQLVEEHTGKSFKFTAVDC